MTQAAGITRRTLSRLMREARKTAGFKAGDAARAAGISPPTLSKYERAENPWPSSVVYQLCDEYGLPSDDRGKLVELAKQREPGWWQTNSIPDWFTPYIGAESEATELENYDDALVPGLSQTPDYARSLIEATLSGLTSAQVDERVAIRTRRQQRLQGEDPLRFSTVFNETALHRTIGGPEVMHEQLAHLLDVAERAHVDLRVLPFSAGAHPATEGSFVLLRFPDIITGVTSGDAVYIEYGTGALFLENEEETAHYTALYRSLQESALDARATTDLIRNVLDEKYT